MANRRTDQAPNLHLILTRTGMVSNYHKIVEDDVGILLNTLKARPEPYDILTFPDPELAKANLSHVKIKMRMVSHGDGECYRPGNPFHIIVYRPTGQVMFELAWEPTLGFTATNPLKPRHGPRKISCRRYDTLTKHLAEWSDQPRVMLSWMLQLDPLMDSLFSNEDLDEHEREMALAHDEND